MTTPLGPAAIEIAPFDATHADGVVELILPIQQSEFGIPITLDQQPDLRDIPSFYQQGSGGFWVALDGAAVVGTIGLLDIGNHQAAVRKMFVAASHRGPERRIAQRLLATLVTACSTHDTKELYLGTTAPMKAAHRFYERNDFKEIERDELPKQFPIMPVDTKFYRRAL